MSMSKQDYERIATGLWIVRPVTPAEQGNPYGESEALDQWKIDVASITGMLANNNPTFDADRFRRWCIAGPPGR